MWPCATSSEEEEEGDEEDENEENEEEKENKAKYTAMGNQVAWGWAGVVMKKAREAFGQEQ